MKVPIRLEKKLSLKDIQQLSDDLDVGVEFKDNIAFLLFEDDEEEPLSNQDKFFLKEI